MNRRDFLQGVVAASALTAVTAHAIAEESAAAPESSTKKGTPLNVFILTGSPRRNGNSAILADEFARGAVDAGHQVTRFDSAFQQVHPCRACDRCRNGQNPCIFQDDYAAVMPNLIAADVIVFASPVYYFSLSAQIKTCIDRFYAVNNKIAGNKRAFLLLTFADGNIKTAAPSVANYKALLDYRAWSDAGQILAKGVWAAGDIQRTDYPKQAYQMGRNLA